MGIADIYAAPKPLFIPAAEVFYVVPAEWRSEMRRDGFYKIEDNAMHGLTWYWSKTPWQD